MNGKDEAAIAEIIVGLIINPLMIALLTSLGGVAVAILQHFCDVNSSKRNTGRAAIVIMGVGFLTCALLTDRHSELHGVAWCDAGVCLILLVIAILFPPLKQLACRKLPVLCWRLKRLSCGLSCWFVGLLVPIAPPYSLWQALKGDVKAIFCSVGFILLILLFRPILAKALIAPWRFGWSGLRAGLIGKPPMRMRNCLVTPGR